jgi:hypothetical protein
LLGVQIECFDNMFFCKATIVHDKGKPVAKQGRKAVSLGQRVGRINASAAGEIVWLPKAVGESRDFEAPAPGALACRIARVDSFLTASGFP